DLYELGAKHEPRNTKWLKSLAAVYLKSKQDKKLGAVLEKLAAADPDDLPVRKKLAEQAGADGDWDAAARWSLEGLHIQVMDVELHAWRGEALLGQGSAAASAKEYDVAAQLEPDEMKWRMAQARALVKAREPAKAKRVLDELLKRDPNYPGAESLLESLE